MPLSTSPNRLPILEAATGEATGPPVRSLLKERAYADLKQRILSGAFAPGSFLSERQLAGQLAMSKTPIRAALERLEMEGLVSISPQQGIIVRDLPVHEIAELYELRAALETYVLRTVAGRLSPAQADRLRANLQAQQEVCPRGDIQRAVALDAAFHLLFCEFLGNRELVRVMEQLRDKIFRVITRVFHVNPDRVTASYGEHRAIAEGVLAGDGPLAARHLVEHLERGKHYLLSPHRAPTA
jgi:DNA-binding GntR family transcriptional regulator